MPEPIAPFDVRGFTAQTKRLTIRRYTMDDLDLYLSLHSDPDVTRYLPYEPRTREAATIALSGHTDNEYLSEKDSRLVTCAFEENEFVGDFYLFLRDPDN